jgi:isoleucyl-tRNA synthetase
MKYRTDRAYWEKWYPADFITESFPGQFRNWFYSLLALSTMMSDGRPPFKTLLGFATVKDQFGDEMHKSAGNSVEFIGAANDGYTIDFELKSTASPDAVAAVLALAEGTKDPTKLLRDTLAASSSEPSFYPTLTRALLAADHREVVEKDRRTAGGAEKYRAVRAHYEPMSADVIRWMYCRHEPAANLRFGPVTADEVRARFHLKLWNCYALFCNYAIPDGFDPGADPVPVAARPEIDRWILAELQKLVECARKAFEQYDVMAFSLAAEDFIDANLSNWYIRRNRDRFWSKNAELDAAGLTDKRAAYQTLYTVLTTLCKLIAPCVPFVSEVMWRNLRTPADPESVHLCDYPVADPALVDDPLTADMDAVRRLVTLGGAARNTAKVNVRQPLAELKVQPAGDAYRRAVEGHSDLVADELNVKRVTLHDPVEGDLLTATAKLNMKTAGAKVGAKRKEVEAALAATSATKLKEKLRGGPIEVGEVLLDAADVTIEFAAPAGWAGAEDRGTQVAIDTRITTELKLEGLARNVIRQVQDSRKTAGLDLADKIALHLGPASEQLGAAILAHKNAIATATQAVEWADAPLNGEAHTATVKVEGQDLTISLRKA